MMQEKNKFSWAIHKNYQEFIVKHKRYGSILNKHTNLRMLVIRSATNLYESITLDLKAFLRTSESPEGEFSLPSRSNKKMIMHLLEKLYTFLSISMPTVIIPGLCMNAILWIFSNITLKYSIFTLNILIDVFSIIIFLRYLYTTTKWKGIRRIVRYYRANNKATFAFEAWKGSTLGNLKPYSTHSPICSTDLLLLTGLICTLLFSISNVLVQFVTHLFVILLVFGIFYAVLKLSERYQNITHVKYFTKPGNWLPKITTKKPDRDQLEITSLALKAVL